MGLFKTAIGSYKYPNRTNSGVSIFGVRCYMYHKKPKGQQLQFQIETFRKVIRENLSHRGKKINFIHGIGDGILKAAIRKELDEVLALRCSYSVGDPAVTIVSIK